MRQSPFFSIWIHPRETVRTIVATNPRLHVVWLAALAGIDQALDRASTHANAQFPSLPVFLVAAVGIGAVGGLFSLWLGAFIVRWTGRWIGGAASSEYVRAAMAWAAVPAVLSLLLWVLRIVLFGREPFTVGMIALATPPPRLATASLVIELSSMILAIWNFVLLCHTVAEVQGFRSAWKGLANLVLAFAMVAVPLIVAIAGVIYLTMR